MIADIHDQPYQRWVSARHEAGHAVAALHYDCPFESVTIKRQGDSLGKIRRMRHRYLGDAVAVMCGPLAEREWKEHRRGLESFKMYGTDHALGQRLNDDKRARCVAEAMRFMRKRLVQQQIDRVARALRDREELTADDVRIAAGFSRALCSKDFR